MMFRMAEGDSAEEQLLGKAMPADSHCEQKFLVRT